MADLAKDESEIFEALAEVGEDGRYFVIGCVIEGADEVVTFTSLVGVIAGEVGGGLQFDLGEMLGVDAAPEEDEIADVFVDFAFSIEGIGSEADIAFGNHFDD